MSRPPSPRVATLAVASLALGGDAVAHVEGDPARRAVFVPGALPGERVEAEVDLAARPARGRVLRVVDASASRVEPPCPVAARCGGCDWMHLAVEAQVAAHAELVAGALTRAGLEVPPIVTHAAPATTRFRTRARLAIVARRGHAVVGFRSSRSHDVVGVDTCLVLAPPLDATLPLLRELLAAERGEGEASVALGHGGKPVLDLRWQGELSPGVFAALERGVAEGRWAGAELWTAGTRTPARIGDARVVTAGGDDQPLVAPSAGFTQAQPAMNALLASRAVALLEADGRDVLELFSGSGNLTVVVARVAARVHAIEADAHAAQAARDNLAARGLTARVTCGDAEAAVVPPTTRRALLDPPRAGAPHAVAALAASRAERIVYVACEPGALARDAAVLGAAGFRLGAVETFEMFPHTHHVETVAAFVRPRARPS